MDNGVSSAINGAFSGGSANLKDVVLLMFRGIVFLIVVWIVFKIMFLMIERHAKAIAAVDRVSPTGEFIWGTNNPARNMHANMYPVVYGPKNKSGEFLSDLAIERNEYEAYERGYY